MTPQEQQEYLMFQRLQQKYGQTVTQNIPLSIAPQPQPQPQPPTKAKPKKKKVVRKTDMKLGFWVLCFIVTVITANFLYNEFTRVEPQPAKVVYKKVKK